MNKLSVVVIIYKVEKYLKQCLDSILSQTYKDFELILVDDGSPDGCPAICDEYADKDARISVIHQKNQGSVMARWNGFLAATGEYISFIDGDDWIDPDMFEKLLISADKNNADLVVCGYKEASEDGNVDKGCPIASGLYTGDKVQTVYDSAVYTGKFYEAGINPSLWNKLIRRSLLLGDYIPADPSLKMGDDGAVSYPAISKAKSIYIDNEFHPYNYRIVSGSLSRAFDIEFFNRAIKLFSGLADNLKNNEAMFKGIYPYSLFITKIGILKLMERGNGLKLSEKKKILTDYYSSYTKFLTTKAVKSEISIDFDSERMLYLFTQGKVDKLIRHIYFDKVISKIKR